MIIPTFKYNESTLLEVNNVENKRLKEASKCQKNYLLLYHNRKQNSKAAGQSTNSKEKNYDSWENVDNENSNRQDQED